MIKLAIFEIWSVGFLTIHAIINLFVQLAVLPLFQPVFTFEFRAQIYNPIQSMASPVYPPLPPFTSIINLAIHTALGRGLVPPLTSSVCLFFSISIPMDKAMVNKLAEIEAIIQWIPKVPTPIKKILRHSYTDFPFVDFITLVKIPNKFSFPNMTLYADTTYLVNHIASYKQRMFTSAIP